MELVFEWDARKAKENYEKHNVRFEEAKTIFFDPYLITYEDELHSIDEERFISIGYSTRNRVLLVVHTEQKILKDSVTIRIISSRKTTPLERKQYEE